MRPKSFTVTWLNSLGKQPPDKRVDYTEPGRRGFMVRHMPSGEVSFVVRYQLDGKTRVMTLGGYPSLSLSLAHEGHQEVRRILEQGIDPIEDRSRRNQERTGKLTVRKQAETVTVRNVIAEWGWHYARPRRRRAREAVRLLKAHLAPLDGKPAIDISKRDLVLIIDKVRHREAMVMANRLCDLLKQVFQFAAERDLIPYSPASGLSKKPGGAEYARHRFLNGGEIAIVWSTLAPLKKSEADKRKHAKGEIAISDAVRLALKLVLVTGQRPGEVSNARWCDIDIAQRLWTIPPTAIKTTKKGDAEARAHYVPLTDLAIEVLEQLRTLANGRPCVMPHFHSLFHPDAPCSEKALSRALHNCVVESKGNPSTLFGIPVFKPNDLRRTAATHMGRLGFSRLHQDKVLNHSDGSIGGVYDQHTYWPEKLKALTAWEDELRSIIAGTRSIVVPIRAA